LKTDIIHFVSQKKTTTIIVLIHWKRNPFAISIKIGEKNHNFLLSFKIWSGKTCNRYDFWLTYVFSNFKFTNNEFQKYTFPNDNLAFLHFKYAFQHLSVRQFVFKKFRFC
jgi:hypothetical protein